MDSSGKPSFFLAIIPVIFLITLLFCNVLLFESTTLYGASQMALLLAAAVALSIGYFLKISWEEMLKKILQGIFSALPSILILLMIGCLTGTWMISGIVPSIIYYGLNILNPSIFLVAALFISAIISITVGSSWTTIATMGIALLGIGKTLHFDEGLIAGAIISGAYFGDKISPISDTTNLAAAVTNTPLFTHIRYMALTTVPSFIITVIIFTTIGFFHQPQAAVSVVEIQKSLQDTFFIHPILFIVPLITVILIIRKIAPLPVLMISSVIAVIFAVIFQPNIIQSMAFENDIFQSLSTATQTSADIWSDYKWQGNYIIILQSMFGSTQIPTQNILLQSLLTTGGMSGMLNTVWLIITAMVFGGSMEATKLLEVITEKIISRIRSVGSLIQSTIITTILNNILTADQYLSIVLSGRMYKDIYQKKRLKSENLSRTLEDGATVTSVLIPWNTCGATQASVLNVATLTYLPFCFFNIISPFMSILFGHLKIKLRYQSPEEEVKKNDTSK